MPELPDVEAFRQSLIRDGAVGARIVGVDVLRESIVKAPSTGEFVERVLGSTVQRLDRRAKFLLAALDEGSLVLHMGMTGAPRIEPSSAELPAYTRFVLALGGGRSLRFVDPRVFGSVWWVADPVELVSGLGPEPLMEDLSPNPEFGVAFLREQLAGRRAPVKALLLDQGVAAGVGNIYADEALFAARLHPLRAAGSLDEREVETLRDAVVSTLARAVRTLDALVWAGDIVEPPTESQEGAAEVLRMPRNAGAPCIACGTPIERSVVGGRGTYTCPTCQGGKGTPARSQP